MIVYVNPIHGDDATAEPNNRDKPWRDHATALAVLESARAAQQAAGGITEAFRMVETHKPPRA